MTPKWEIVQTHTGYCLFKGQWPFGELFTLSNKSINDLHQANVLLAKLIRLDELENANLELTRT